MVQKIFRPSMRQPESLRVAVVEGRVRSCCGSLIAAANTARSAAISRNATSSPRARRWLPAATAIRQRRAMFTTAIRCMFTPIATEAFPRARIVEATMRS